MKTIKLLIFTLVLATAALAQDWRKMDEADLRKAVPDKAPVIRENIETEFRTAAGITNGKASLFGVVLITAGYEADGKYTHYLRLDVPVKIGDIPLAKGDYIFGYQRLDVDTLRVTFYKASDGELIGAAKAKVEKGQRAIYSFLITPPVAGAGKVFIGRFSVDYSF